MFKQSGFTLVELAIVLVIIGLIIGGVLVGQDLIKAATIRSTVGDVEKFNAGATAFRGKYNGLPGDLTAARAIQFGLSASGDNNATGALGLRDGNGILEGAGGFTTLSGENALFWQDLGTAGLVTGRYTGIGITETVPTITTATAKNYLPSAKLRATASFFTYSASGRNVYYVGSLTQASSDVVASEAPAVTALEAKGIDQKIDDGAPTTGILRSMNSLSTPNPGASPTPNVCNTSAMPSVYNVNVDSGKDASDNLVCQLQLRTSF